MPRVNLSALGAQLAQLDTENLQYAPNFVSTLLAAAVEACASDVHLLPTPSGLEVRIRLDGVLQTVGVFESRAAPNVVARLKVLADLLTYRIDVPQEGRLRAGGITGELRLSTFPTLYGEKAVVRIFAESRQLLRLADLGLPESIAQTLLRKLHDTSGAILITGPAGCGKTTTAYACMRELVASSNGGRSLVSLEDPIEMAVPGVAQSQANPAADFDLPKGLKFLLRQDPEVIMVGEVRDRPTAELAFQAALTGHLVISTFHSGSAAGAISRLSDMQIAPYLLRSGLLAVVSQRLARRLCHCATTGQDPEGRAGLDVASWRIPAGCPDCGGSGYSGRVVIAELLDLENRELARAVLSRSDSLRLEEIAVAGGMTSRWRRSCQAVEAGLTSPAEIRRVLGFGDPPSTPSDERFQ
jgi:type II secretory ATPase GspE/PulE/Tfp pilus assembly ATPase PilB-like protein